MIKYRHKVTGLFLTKKYRGYSAVYHLSEKETMWTRPVLKTLSLTKDPDRNDSSGCFLQNEFEEIRFKFVKDE